MTHRGPFQPLPFYDSMFSVFTEGWNAPHSIERRSNMFYWGKIIIRQSSRPAWTRSCAACCRWPCFGRGVGLDPQRSLPTPTILWFCDLLIHYSCSMNPSGIYDDKLPLALNSPGITILMRHRCCNTLQCFNRNTCHLTRIFLMLFNSAESREHGSGSSSNSLLENFPHWSRKFVTGAIFSGLDIAIFTKGVSGAGFSLSP